MDGLAGRRLVLNYSFAFYRDSQGNKSSALYAPKIHRILFFAISLQSRNRMKTAKGSRINPSIVADTLNPCRFDICIPPWFKKKSLPPCRRGSPPSPVFGHDRPFSPRLHRSRLRTSSIAYSFSSISKVLVLQDSVIYHALPSSTSFALLRYASCVWFLAGLVDYHCSALAPVGAK